ncbi:MAG TPA: ComEA family DNA-binding protein [Gemmatimonadales bacterium]|nr:ComEA family DNA-binding protein [Gemmatimonadales bacterium]
MPPAEQRALLLLLALAVAGQGVRYLLSRPGEPLGQVQLLATLPTGSPLAQRDSAMRQARPLEPNERIDVDRASAQELARLPRVGLRLAKVIQADRESHGPFGSLESLDRVPGVGPGLLKLIGPHVTFSAPAATGKPTSAPSMPSLPLPGAPAQRLNLNTASLTELDALPGLGPARAAAIVQYRQQHGAFTSVDDLARVPGLGPAAVARLRPYLANR